ncbi:hypothetical protein [Azospirillum sp. TSO35-2]|nr:hypothetical protein [Azospirillum sp. TSO35-2]
MLKTMIVHTLIAMLAIGAMAVTYQASAEGTASVAGLWSAGRSHDD